MTHISGHGVTIAPQRTEPLDRKKPLTQALAESRQATAQNRDEALVGKATRGSLPMKPVILGSLAATATAVTLAATLKIYKPGGFGPVGSSLVSAALFSPSSVVSGSAAYADNAAQGLLGSAAVGALNGLVMGASSGQIVDVNLQKSLLRAGAFAVVGAASATVGALTSRAVGP